MPKSRLPREVRSAVRELIWNRDRRRCTHCEKRLTLKQANMDHIQSGKLATNKFSNLRTLCKTCHILRADLRHRGMVAKALRAGDIPPNWRELVWEG
jgi:5-methylcytosine-specific restriction endonuclease McrA